MGDRPGRHSGKRRRPGARRRGYDAEWEQLQKRVVAWWRAEGLPCGLCGRPIRATARVDVDHIQTVAEAPERRLDPSNLRVAHHHCHSRRTAQDRAAAERGFVLGVGEDGMPIDEQHPFRKGRS